MSYLSPFHILAETLGTIENIDQTMLRKAKRRLLSEFELLEATTIEISGKEFDKDSIIKLFEQLENEDNLQYHLMVYNDVYLLHFLEQGNIKIFMQPSLLKGKEENKGFVNFITPYFADVYNKELYECVRSSDINGVEMLVSHQLPIDFRQEAAAYKNTYRHIKGKTNDLQALTFRAKKEHILGSEVISYFEPSFIEIFNLLPAYFSGVRSEFASLVDGLAVDLYNKSRRTSLAIEILEAVMRLDVNDMVKHELNYVYGQIKPEHKTFRRWAPEEKQDNYTMNVIIIAVQILFVLLVLFLAFRGSSSSSTSYNSPIPEELMLHNNPSIIGQEQIDSNINQGILNLSTTNDSLHKRLLEIQNSLQDRRNISAGDTLIIKSDE